MSKHTLSLNSTAQAEAAALAAAVEAEAAPAAVEAEAAPAAVEAEAAPAATEIDKAYVVTTAGIDRMLNLLTNEWIGKDPKKVDLDPFIVCQVAAGKMEIVAP